VFEGLRAAHNLRFREILPAGWELSAVTDADGIGFTWDRGSNLIDLGTLSDDAGSQRRIRLVNRKLPAGVVRDTGRTLPEMVNETRTFGLPAGNRITIGGSNGFEIRDAITDQIPTAGSRLLSFPDTAKYGALVIEHPSGNGSDTLFSHGPSGWAITQFFPDIGDFGFTQISFPPGQNFTDAVYFGDDPAASGVLAVSFTGSAVIPFVWRDFSGQLVFSAGNGGVTRFAVGNGTGFVSAFAGPLKFTPAGNVAADNTNWIATVLDGTPGKLWVSDPKLPLGPGTFVGDVGNSPRRIRCLVSHSLCAVSNFESDSLTLVQWNGRETAAIVGTQAVGDGPVGIDLRADGVNAKVISTGFNDHTFTVTTLAPNGSVLSSVTQAVPAGCVNPGHAQWLSGVPGTAVVTCKGSYKYALITP
jgi:hypothetical protein